MKNKDGTALEPDPKTASIVQKIFAMAHGGKFARAIATALTENGDITPLKYRALYRDTSVKEVLQELLMNGITKR